MPGSVVTPVKRGGVGNIEMTHEARQIPGRCHHQKVKMVGHAHIAQQGNVVNLKGIGQFFKKHQIVVLVLENITPFVSSSRDVVICALILDA